MRVLESGNLTMGKEVKNFETKMSNYLGVKHFIMVNSGSSANLLMIEALMRPAVSRPRLNLGDSVLVPAIAWPTTIWPLIQLGLNPIFVDVDPKTLALDLVAAQKLLDLGSQLVGFFQFTHLVMLSPPLNLKNLRKEMN
jgi:CDP-6-deoxy-D-xylo-4-hexulose-3-dehydrase